MLKIKLQFEFDEEQLREIFESLDIKFTKKKVKELKDEIDESGLEVDWESDLVDDIEEYISNLLTDMFDK